MPPKREGVEVVAWLADDPDGRGPGNPSKGMLMHAGPETDTLRAFFEPKGQRFTPLVPAQALGELQARLDRVAELAEKLEASVTVNRRHAARPPKLGGAEESSETYSYVADVKQDVADAIRTLLSADATTEKES